MTRKVAAMTRYEEVLARRAERRARRDARRGAVEVELPEFEPEAEPEAEDLSKEAELFGYEGLTLAELREILAVRELPTSGNKAELIERLVEDDG